MAILCANGEIANIDESTLKALTPAEVLSILDRKIAVLTGLCGGLPHEWVCEGHTWEVKLAAFYEQKLGELWERVTCDNVTAYYMKCSTYSNVCNSENACDAASAMLKELLCKCTVSIVHSQDITAIEQHTNDIKDCYLIYEHTTRDKRTSIAI